MAEVDRMDLRQMRYFVAVAEERHFGRAAARLHIAQPPLSQQIRRIEAELGEPLLYRTTRSVELAPAGEVLLERSRDILAAVDAAIEDARRAAHGEYGRLAIGFTGSATYALLPALAAALRRELPGVALDLRGELLTPTQVARLTAGTLDLGLLRPPIRDRSLSTEVLRSEPLIAVLPESHPLAAADAISLERLKDEPFVTYPSHFRSVLHDAVEDACAAHGFTPRAAHEVAETATLVSFVAAGLGVSLVPASVRNMTVEGAVYRPLSQDTTRVQLAAAWKRDDNRPALARALDITRQVLQDA
jgi:DNA-binding transcriptional LysR family regulator